jgi:hypothetical protein
MIAIYGDSWGWSYKDIDGIGEQVFFGQSLSDNLTEIYNIEVTNFCERAASNFLTIEKIQATTSLFNPGDILFVLQTDPLRSLFKPWQWTYRNTFESKTYPLVLDQPTTLRNICNNYILKDFYTMLVTIQKEYNVEIVLHGGVSKVNQTLASSLGLKCTDKSSTEIIVPGFKDCYFYHDVNFAGNLYEFSKFPNYVKDHADELFLLNQLKKKENLWKSLPEYFTYNHTTEAGTRMIAKYISEFPDIDKYRAIKKT